MASGCVPTAESTRLQQTAQNPKPYRQLWLVTVVHKTKSIDMNTREKLVGMSEETQE